MGITWPPEIRDVDLDARFSTPFRITPHAEAMCMFEQPLQMNPHLEPLSEIDATECLLA
jgi:hypothetical protein